LFVEKIKSRFNLQKQAHQEAKVCCNQWRAEVWWCQGRLLDCMPTYQILVLRSGVCWSLLLD